MPSTYSSPIALSPDERLLWVVNPDDDSVTIIDTATNAALATIAVGDEPRSIAIDPRNRYAFVANAAGNSVTVLRILDETPEDLEVEPDDRVGPDGELITGAEPWSVVVSPDGRRVFVANSGQDTITVIDVRASGGRRSSATSTCATASATPATPSATSSRAASRSPRTTASSTPRASCRSPRANGVQGDDEGKIGVVCRLDIDTSSTDLADYQPAQRITARAPGHRLPVPAASPRTPRRSRTSCRAS